ncbi:maltase A3-like [Phymastichus coffea]|uniref:maltase A3-like n=1 Tax=Phymastichus coffea TaxID=108790 RepID=UPI00273C47D1|nr:maltase A3-like [Phymastichus coffea]XP_058789955.1 maltase A3-like [Phymastichus coffea]XP_058789956.1 maltase A3-like [Phymastichus coffea]
MSPPMSKVPLLLSALLLLLPCISAGVVDTTTDIASTTEYDSSDISATYSTEINEVDEVEIEKEIDENDWRNNTLIYYIWVRAFRDSDGDGNGDLRGIINRLDYLYELGIKTIRLSPIYTSPMIDSGYDIQNFTDVNPMFGNMIDFEELVHKAHNRDLRIILDIVPNHSSDQHEWFTSSAVTCAEDPYDDYYIWADGIVEDNKVLPPNNWKNIHSDTEGSAWTWHPKRRQWYYHRLHQTEPELNLRNENVIQEFLDIFDFWLEKGVDGFSISGISYFLEDESLRDEIEDDDNDNDEDNHNTSCCMGISETAEILFKFRDHIDQWVQDNNAEPKLLLGEVDESDDNIINYYGNQTHLGITPLNTVLITKLNKTSDAKDIKEVIEDWMERIPEGAKTNWILSDQDHSRATSRLDLELIDGLNMLALLLPGQAITYYGEEIGMVSGNISREDSIDLTALEILEDSEELSRDSYRTPMQWDSSTSAGFSYNESTFLPVNPDYIEINVDKQLNDVNSDLEAYKKLAVLRQGPIFTEGDYQLDVVNEDNVLLLKRTIGNDSCIAIINFGSSKEIVNLTALYPDLEKDLQVMLDSSNADVEIENDQDDDDDIENDSFILNANAAAVLCDKEDFEEFIDDINSSEIESASTTTTEEPSLVIPVTTTEASTPSSAYTKKAFQFVINLLLLSVLRIL